MTDAPARAGSTKDTMDALSLEQALIDTEVATARVVDLTSRLLELNRLLDEERAAHDAERLEWARIRRSRAFRLAERVWSMRARLNV